MNPPSLLPFGSIYEIIGIGAINLNTANLIARTAMSIVKLIIIAINIIPTTVDTIGIYENTNFVFPVNPKNDNALYIPPVNLFVSGVHVAFTKLNKSLGDVSLATYKSRVSSSISLHILLAFNVSNAFPSSTSFLSSSGTKLILKKPFKIVEVNTFADCVNLSFLFFLLEDSVPTFEASFVPNTNLPIVLLFKIRYCNEYNVPNNNPLLLICASYSF